MQLLPTDTDHVPPNMHLATPVQDSQGQLLLPAGAEITLSVLRGLHKRGIQTVQVDVVSLVTPPAALQAQDPAIAFARIEERLRHLFRKSLDAGQINPLFHLVLEHRMRSERHDAQASHN